MATKSVEKVVSNHYLKWQRLSILTILDRQSSWCLGWLGQVPGERPPCPPLSVELLLLISHGCEGYVQSMMRRGVSTVLLVVGGQNGHVGMLRRRLV